MARWTNDKWRSTLHRVINPPIDPNKSNRRISAAFFHNPNPDAIISTIETCLDEGESKQYEDINFGEYLFSKNYSSNLTI